MDYLKTKVPGVIVLVPELIPDNRGYFARVFSARDLEENSGFPFPVCQVNHSFNRLKGTLRGLHFLKPPYQENKLVLVVKGAILDVALDLRPNSPTYKQWHSEILTAENAKKMLIPAGCAHGFQTLDDQTEVFYLVSEYYEPLAEGGLRWNDPSLDLNWPFAPPLVISEKDQSWPDFDWAAHKAYQIP
ncbi:MAG: dTDP-4-dehydrorhamnose 3,5-epimerase [Deltaproteobacteria bacterium]|jgi:dTDP-4-dehydrorhamnose 3,5-epimerase|nr:dTDP-4-dehydrorhamnose 3,5-epimerase [Deltaproteobacteria bacterium]